MPKKRLRIFAGPNGSGKSTIIKAVNAKVGCPYFVNADEICQALRQTGRFNFTKFLIETSKEELCSFVAQSTLFQRMEDDATMLLEAINVENNVLFLPDKYVTAYLCAILADFLRMRMLNIVEQFTIETVMSDSRKLDYFSLAKSLGYRLYLYFVSTKDPDINVERVKQRVASGGHNVPEEKIRSRYYRSLENVYDLLKICDRAYFVDNSAETWDLVAEYDAGTGDLILSGDMVPYWFNKYIVEKIK